MESKNPTAQEFADEMAKIREEVGSALKKAAEDMKKYYDRNRKESVEYKPGDKVWLEGTNITTDRPSKKLGDMRYGPIIVKRKIGASSYELDIPKSWKKIHNVFNEVLLSPYHPPEFPNQLQNYRPPPEVVAEGEEPEFVVEEIVDSRKGKGGKVFYKVNWKGYGPHEMTWEPIENLERAKDAIKEFHKLQPNKPRAKELRKLEIPIHLFPTHLL